MPLTSKDILFSPSYRIHRHVIFWVLEILIWAGFWTMSFATYWDNIVLMILWVPVKILYSYPFMYLVIPRCLFKEKYLQFATVILSWGVAGWFLNYLAISYWISPMMHAAGKTMNINPWNATTYLCLTTGAAGTIVIKMCKFWVENQRKWLMAEQEKITAQLQLLKAQLHPHFLFNTLNNVYSFALENSPKTPQMILKLSSLLSYMLYECKTDEVLLEKEVEVMKNYIGLEKERYGDKLDISLNIEGDIEDKFISPLLILPFLENAFKHGTSEQLERPWMSIDLAVKDHELVCKVVNSKNELIPFHENGVGINNVKKRLELLYPGKHELRLADEGEFFVVNLWVNLRKEAVVPLIPIYENNQRLRTSAYENSLLINR